MTGRRLRDFAGSWSAAAADRAEAVIREGRRLSDEKLRDLFEE